jgi:hypothetical protein
MRCLAPWELTADFGESGFSASEIGDYRTELKLNPTIAVSQIRIGARPPAEVASLFYFVGALNRWLPTDRPRLLWIEHWDSAVFAADDDFVLAARLGCGEARPLAEVPGHYFDPHPYNEQDQLEVSRQQRADLACLVGMTSMVMLTGSDGWLIAGGSQDRIEFREGNLFFHSAEPQRLVEAELLLDNLNCSRTLE